MSTITLPRELVKRAEIALERFTVRHWSGPHAEAVAVIDTLRAALSAPPAPVEPVAWWIPKAEQFAIAKPGERPFAKAWEPLYAAPSPTPQEAPEGLTDEAKAAIIKDTLGEFRNGVTYDRDDILAIMEATAAATLAKVKPS